MKKSSTGIVIATALACSLTPTTALAMGAQRLAQGAVGAGLGRQVGAMRQVARRADAPIPQQRQGQTLQQRLQVIPSSPNIQQVLFGGQLWQQAPNAGSPQQAPFGGQQQMSGNGKQQDQQQAPGAGQQGKQQPGAGNQQPGAGQQQDQQQAPGAGQQGQRQPGAGNQQPGAGQQGTTGSVSSPLEVVEGTSSNSAESLIADLANATYYDVSETSQVKIDAAGTYVVSGTCANGNVTVKKGVTGVVLVLKDLDLTSTTGATVSVNKTAEAKIVISGDVRLTDAENAADESSADAEVADAFDGAAIKVKADAVACICGDGTLTVKGNAKNGIKAGDDASLVIDGATITIDAANDAINANYDLAITDGSLTIKAADDAIHADRILTVGNSDGTGPTITITSCTEGLEATVVNIFGGSVNVTSTDDAINAANADGAYKGELTYSINMRGGSVIISSRGDGMDSNGNVNLIAGSASISSASMGGEAGIDYDGDFYLSSDFRLTNNSGVAGPDGQPAQAGGQICQQMGGQMGGGMGQQTGSQMGRMQQGLPSQAGGNMGMGGRR